MKENGNSENETKSFFFYSSKTESGYGTPPTFLIASQTACCFSRGQSATMQPPPPAPINFEPKAPASLDALQSSLRRAVAAPILFSCAIWADMSSPTRAKSPDLRHLTPSWRYSSILLKASIRTSSLFLRRSLYIGRNFWSGRGSVVSPTTSPNFAGGLRRSTLGFSQVSSQQIPSCEIDHWSILPHGIPRTVCSAS